MPHDNLWAPWRLEFVAGGAQTATPPDRQLAWLPGADASCFLCRGQADTADRENLVVLRTDHSLVVLNRYPYTNGHLLVAPRRHLPRLNDLSADEQQDIMRLITQMTALLERLMKPDGFNVGLNLGQAAGAGLPGHLHWHVVPRWRGDTNFMPVIAGVRVIPQSLDALWELVQEGLRSPPGPSS